LDQDRTEEYDFDEEKGYNGNSTTKNHNNKGGEQCAGFSKGTARKFLTATPERNYKHI